MEKAAWPHPKPAISLTTVEQRMKDVMYKAFCRAVHTLKKKMLYLMLCLRHLANLYLITLAAYDLHSAPSKYKYKPAQV